MQVRKAQATTSSSRTALPPRIVTAAALYDGHDAAINVVRRGLVQAGAEVVHLGHNRSAYDIARAAVEEDAGAVAVSSYQGGHGEFFPYLRQLLDDMGAAHVVIFAGGGGVILPEEIAELQRQGVEKVFSPEDGFRLGLAGMMRQIVEMARQAGGVTGETAKSLTTRAPTSWEPLSIARAITAVELGEMGDPGKDLAGHADGVVGADVAAGSVVCLGVTGTGGAGKSSLLDELVLRVCRDFPDLRVGILAVDPTKRKTGGALLGDRLRMNSIYRKQVFLRSVATRGSGTELSPVVRGAVSIFASAGADLVIVETTGIGQGSSEVLSVADLSLYVMTSDFGGPTQLEKIDMLDYADLVAVNKADRRGAEDSVRMVRRQVARGEREPLPVVVSTVASHFNDAGVNELYGALLGRLGNLSPPSVGELESARPVERVIPQTREHHLGEAAEAVRRYKERTEADVAAMRRLEGLEMAADVLGSSTPRAAENTLKEVAEKVTAERDGLTAALLELQQWQLVERAHSSDKLTYRVRDREHSVELRRKTLSGLSIPRVALPSFGSQAELLRFLREENLPGHFPFTGGVFPIKRDDEMPTRQFAGEGTPERTNRRFHLLCDGQPAKRLSVAFDSVTLYGSDPDERPDIYGKIGTSGVSIATLDDMRKLFRGIDLLDPSTSVSMTINGPAPTLLAMFFNAAIDQQTEQFRRETRRDPGAEESRKIRSQVFEKLRGTVQADILKEDQAQNTCILSTEFALNLMGDVQEYFVTHKIRNYYSVSISGYHIAEAGANPLTQLAFTLANGLTYLEFFKARGLAVDDCASSFSFFFSNGLDPEYSVLGRVARRVWAVILRDLYGASVRSQKLKYHIQTSGRSLHAREIGFNDIRTTLQALMAVYDNCNSLHTNAYDEAITTPTEESVRRALAIQLIVQKEMGLTKNENTMQGSFVVRELTDLVEEAVLDEFCRLSERGGVLGAMETGYMRNRIQEESILYEKLKHSGELPIIGVNTFFDPAPSASSQSKTPVVRSTEEEKGEQIKNLREFQERNAEVVGGALSKLRDVVLNGDNIFDELMHTVQYASLGQITETLFEVGGQYRRSL
jgi:methylmalonyl-CoA mutase